MDKVTWYGSSSKPLADAGERVEASGQVLNIRIGKVIAGDNASVTNSGTGNDVVLDFVLPRGEKGESSLAGISAFFEGLSVELAILQEKLPFQSMQMGKELCVPNNPNVQLVETWGTGNSACYKITFPTPFSDVPVLLVSSSRATRQMHLLEVVEQTATHFLVASNYWGNDCLVNWVAFEV